MTVREAAYIYGIKKYKTSEADTLTSIVYKLYGSYDDVYFIILRTLNLRFDWFSVPAGTEISYLDKSIAGEIYEITS